MAKTRKTKFTGTSSKALQAHEHSVDETFGDSEDEFFAHRDKILLDEGPAAKRRRKLEDQDEAVQPSDEEVFKDRSADEDEDDEETGGINGAESESDDAAGLAQEREDDEDDENFWGTSRGDYYNADIIETEADALEEEAEARRLRQKQLKNMTHADFGLDESGWTLAETVEDPGRPVVEKLPPVQIPQNATKDELMVMLRTRYPEFEPLSEDLVALQPRLEALKVEVERRHVNDADRARREPSLVLTKYRAVSAYLATIAMYMATLTSGKDGLALSPAELRDHPLMATLLRCRQLWYAIKDQEEPEETLSVDRTSTQIPKSTAVGPETSKQFKQQKKEIAAPVAAPKQDESISGRPGRSKPKTKVDQRDQGLRAPEPKREEKKRKQKRPDLRDILARATHAASEEDAADFGDEPPLTREEAAEKASKKKTLRFYTSQIAQKANKRGAASRDAGGDDDHPYKERIKDKQARLMREAEQRVNQPMMEDDGSEDIDDKALASKINAYSNNYYNEVVAKSQQKKADKKARADAYAEAARQGAQVYKDEQIGPDGKRRITYAIAKNKGLVPKRKKEVRNPRVKKKKRYEQKMKKLSSIRPVYKGGEGKGGYGGELTGIKTNVVKSVKL